jgi:hypothetical protein
MTTTTPTAAAAVPTAGPGSQLSARAIDDVIQAPANGSPLPPN